MKIRLIVGVVALLAGMVYAQEPPEPPARPQPPRPEQFGKESGRSTQRRGFGEMPGRPKWEYSVRRSTELAKEGDGDLQAALNKLGEEGWELVAVRPVEGGKANRDTYYFKRGMSPPPMGMGAMGGRGGFMGPGGFGGAMGGAVAARPPQARPEGEPRERGRSAERSVHVIALKHAAATDLGGLLNQLFGERGARVFPDPRTNSLLVSGTDEQLRAIREVLVELDKADAEKRK